MAPYGLKKFLCSRDLKAHGMLVKEPTLIGSQERPPETTWH
jgi:hypothetical protein